MAADSEDDQTLDLEELSVNPSISVVEAVSSHLTELYETGRYGKLIKSNFSELQDALRLVLESAVDPQNDLERRDNTKRCFMGLMLTILDPNKIDSKLVAETLEFILKDPIAQIRSPVSNERRAAILSASLHCGVLYHTLESDRPLLQQWDLIRAFRWCVNLGRLNSAKNLLYVIATMPPCTLAQIISSSYSERMLPIAFAMIEMGVFCYHQDCVADNRSRGAMFDKLVAEIKQQPLTLQQLARRAIRGTMKDVDVVRGSYRLPIPKLLQDYVSLKFLDATITHMYFPDAIPTGYDVTYDINRTYGTAFPVNAPLKIVKKWEWKLRCDMP